jgi:hypothetical protein
LIGAEPPGMLTTCRAAAKPRRRADLDAIVLTRGGGPGEGGFTSLPSKGEGVWIESAVRRALWLGTG